MDRDNGAPWSRIIEYWLIEGLLWLGQCVGGIRSMGTLSLRSDLNGGNVRAKRQRVLGEARRELTTACQIHRY